MAALRVAVNFRRTPRIGACGERASRSPAKLQRRNEPLPAWPRLLAMAPRTQIVRRRTLPTPRLEPIMNKPQTKHDTQQPAKKVYRELVTINGKNVVLAHNEPPVINAGVLEFAEIFRMFNIFDEKFSPTNIDKADGTPLRLYTSDRVKVDVSKRRKHDMGFWHRNIDAHEIIFCVKGALKWETEMGVKIMHPGDMLFIPKGIGHRSMLCEDSTDDNVLIELKIADELTYVGDNK
jgi:hypothetical protein